MISIIGCSIIFFCNAADLMTEVGEEEGIVAGVLARGVSMDFDRDGGVEVPKM